MTKNNKNNNKDFKIMAQIAKEKKAAVKKVAYEKKQEEGGKKVMSWIFGVLIALAILFVAYSIFVVA
jgi:cell division protein FtsX